MKSGLEMEKKTFEGPSGRFCGGKAVQPCHFRDQTKMCGGQEKDVATGEVAWAGGPGPGSARGVKKRHRGSKKRGPQNLCGHCTCCRKGFRRYLLDLSFDLSNHAWFTGARNKSAEMAHRNRNPIAIVIYGIAESRAKKTTMTPLQSARPTWQLARWLSLADLTQDSPMHLSRFT